MLLLHQFLWIEVEPTVPLTFEEVPLDTTPLALPLPESASCSGRRARMRMWTVELLRASSRRSSPSPSPVPSSPSAGGARGVCSYSNSSAWGDRALDEVAAAEVRLSGSSSSVSCSVSVCTASSYSPRPSACSCNAKFTARQMAAPAACNTTSPLSPAQGKEQVSQWFE